MIFSLFHVCAFGLSQFCRRWILLDGRVTSCWPFPHPGCVCQRQVAGRLQLRSTYSLRDMNHSREETGALQLFQLSRRVLWKECIPVLNPLNIVAVSHYGSGAKKALQIRKWTQMTWKVSSSLKVYKAVLLGCECRTGLVW